MSELSGKNFFRNINGKLMNTDGKFFMEILPLEKFHPAVI
jgi:hypothetical protein